MTHRAAFTAMTFAMTLAVLSFPLTPTFAQTTGMPDKKMDAMQGMMGDKMSDAMGLMAGFRGAGEHPAAGTYALANTKGKVTMTTSADFARDPKAPDVYLVLAKGTNVAEGASLWLGKVNKATGAQTFTIPAKARTDGYDTVVLWCKKFGALMGTAPLDAAALAKLRGDAMHDAMPDTNQSVLLEYLRDAAVLR